MKTTRYSEQRCLNCGHRLNAASSFFDETPPHPGDATVCIECGHVMVFGDDMKMREPTGAEVVELAGNEQLLTTMRVLAEAKTKRP